MARFSVILLMAVLVAGFLALLGELNQPVRIVRVLGNITEAEQRQIRDAVTPSLGEGLRSVELMRVAASVYRLSWPRQVTVRRLWPAALELHVERELPIAVWGDEGFLTSEGRVMQFPESSPELPVFSCASSTPREAMEVYGLLYEALTGSGTRIVELSESALGEWEVALENGIRVLLGRHDLGRRMRRFQVVRESVLENRTDAVRYIDARYANGVAVRWQDRFVAYEERSGYGL
jgi:cell division protein FtsQ